MKGRGRGNFFKVKWLNVLLHVDRSAVREVLGAHMLEGYVQNYASGKLPLFRNFSQNTNT